MWKEGTGVVRDLVFVGRANQIGRPWKWTAVIVDLEDDERISAILPPELAKRNRVVVGDWIRLEYQPGKDAGYSWWGGRRGLCKNVEVIQRARSVRHANR